MGSDDNFPACTTGCFFGCGFIGGLASFVLFILFGVFALVPAGPFDDRNKTLGVILVVLGATGVASLGGYLACAVPGAVAGLIIDKSIDRCCSV